MHMSLRVSVEKGIRECRHAHAHSGRIYRAAHTALYCVVNVGRGTI